MLTLLYLTGVNSWSWEQTRVRLSWPGTYLQQLFSKHSNTHTLLSLSPWSGGTLIVRSFWLQATNPICLSKTHKSFGTRLHKSLLLWTSLISSRRMWFVQLCLITKSFCLSLMCDWFNFIFMISLIILRRDLLFSTSSKYTSSIPFNNALQKQ